MKVIVAGSRSITDPQLVADTIAASGFHITELVCGMAKGVDTAAHKWAVAGGVPIKEFPPKYDDYEPVHKALAPLARNKAMAEYADALILIWDGKSRGSMNMFKEAAKRGLKTYVKQT